MNEIGHIYFHAPCFDGIVSCVLTWDFLETSRNWRLGDLFPVNYDARETWLSTELGGCAAVVDFLYHPQAEFWADHHLTTFLNDESRKDFERRRNSYLTYDQRSGSCAMLLWKHMANSFGYQNSRYRTMVEWAEKIDSASYTSVHEAIFGDAPALRIRSSLAQKGGEALSKDLVRALRNQSLTDASELPEVRSRSEEAQSLIQAGLNRFAEGSKLADDGIVLFDVDSRGVVISRYAPYYFFPQARYSVGVVHSKEGAAITAMRNPWREFPSIFLGKIFERFGGGGHQRVGAVFLTGGRAAEVGAIKGQVLEEIRKEDTAKRGSATP